MPYLKPQSKPIWPNQFVSKEAKEAPTVWKGVEMALGARPEKRQRWGGQRTGMAGTPPSDGPWKPSADQIFKMLPPHAREAREDSKGAVRPWVTSSGRKRRPG